MLAIDRYHIKEHIHDGGWYRLYRAESQQHRREVVLKYLADSQPSPAMLACFRSEYRILQRLAMPAVINALALEEHGRRLILVREYFPGQTLRQYALGAMLFELLTGRTPFASADSIEALGLLQDCPATALMNYAAVETDKQPQLLKGAREDFWATWRNWQKARRH